MTNAATLALLPTVVTPTTTGRLGIETTTPGSVLDVNGNASFRSSVSTAGAATVASLTSNGAITTASITATNMVAGTPVVATSGPILTLGALTGGGSGYMEGTHTTQGWTGGTGAYMLTTVVVTAGVVTSVTLTWSGHRYSAGDVLTLGSLSTTLATTATSGTGTTATITFAAQAAAPFQIGSQIIVAGVTPAGYNGTFTVTGCTTTTVSYANATTGVQTVAGTVKMGNPLTSATIPVATVQGSNLYICSYTSDSLAARIRLEANDTSVSAGQEYGAIVFSSRDTSTNSSGDIGLIKGVAAGTAGGSEIQFFTAVNGTSPTISVSITPSGNFRLYNTAGTFYSEFSNSPTANRTITVPDVAGTMSIIQTAAAAGYFDTSTTGPSGTTRLNYGGYFYPTALNIASTGDTATAATHYVVETASDGFIRPKTLANVRTEIVTTAAVNTAAATTVGTVTTGTWNAGSVTSAGLITATGTGLNAGVRFNNTTGARDYRIIQKDGAYLSITDETASAERLNITSAGVMNALMAVNGNSFAINADTLNRFAQGVFVLRNGSPTIYFRDTDQMSAMLHNNGNLFYILRGGVDTESWAQVNGQWPAYWDLSNNNCLFGGAVSAVGDVTAYASDRRLKENIKNIPDALNKVLQLNGVTFSWMDKTKDIGFCVPTKDDIGVIAQEVQAVLPEAVKFAPFDRDEKGNSKSGENYLTVQYEKLTALLIEAVKDQQKMIDELKDRVSSLEAQLSK